MVIDVNIGRVEVHVEIAMPKAKKRKGAGKKGKKKAGGKAKLQAAAEKDELMKKMRGFIKAYQCRCCMDSARERSRSFCFEWWCQDKWYRTSLTVWKRRNRSSELVN